MKPDFAPICTGVCSLAVGPAQISETLYRQHAQYIELGREIARRRLASLTPQTMRAEVADLARRIQALSHHHSGGVE